MEKEPKTILCYGDSNTYGLMPVPGGRYPYRKRWTTLLGNQLGEGYVVVPEGLSGRTTAFDREGAPWKNGLAPLKAVIGSHVPIDVFIIMLGTNDSIPEVGASAEQIAGGMEQVILPAKEAFEELQEEQPQVILAVPAPIGDAYEQSTDTGALDMGAYIKSRQIAGLYEQLAEKHGCTVAEIALRYIFSGPMNVFAVVSSLNEKRMAQNAAAARFPLFPGEVRYLETGSAVPETP
jgi:lysophospholipase L1-like esterase